MPLKFLLIYGLPHLSLFFLWCVFLGSWVIYPVDFLLILEFADSIPQQGLTSFFILCISCKLIVESRHHLLLKLKSRPNNHSPVFETSFLKSVFAERQWPKSPETGETMKVYHYLFPNISNIFLIFLIWNSLLKYQWYERWGNTFLI